MHLTFTPGQFAQRAEFYYQLGQLTAAGLGLVGALEQLQRSPPARSYRKPIRRVLAGLAEGATFSEALRSVSPWLPELDMALLHAGEGSGRLDATFRLLADYYRDRARIARQVIGDLAYPMFLAHFAVFILPFPQLFLSGNWIPYLFQTLGILVPGYLATAFMIYAGQSRHGEAWRSLVEQVLRWVPLLGAARRYLALSRLCAALEALLSAGVTIVEAWEMAATASGSPALRRTVLGWRRDVDGGVTPAQAVTASGFFPSLFANQYASGETSGRLDETLKRMGAYFQEEGTRKLRAVSLWAPKICYLVIMLVIAWRILRFWMNYFSQIGQAGGF